MEPTRPEVCWWCGAPATTREHRYKRTELQRMADISECGAPDPRSLYRSGDSYTGTLNGIKTGSAVQWGKNLCAPCNGARSQPFDYAYEKWSRWMWEHQDDLAAAQAVVDLQDVYGSDWSVEHAYTQRYLAKQLGCMLATNYCEVPEPITTFLDSPLVVAQLGAPQATFFRDRARLDLHTRGREEGVDYRGYWIPEAPFWTTGSQVVAAQYQYFIGFVCCDIRWPPTRPAAPPPRLLNLPLTGAPLRLQRAE